MNLKDKKTIFTIAGIFIAVIFLFQFIYIPRYMEVRRLSLEYKKITSEINEIYNFIGGQEKLKDNIIKIRRQAEELEKAFPFEKEASNIIKVLNEDAERYKINVLSIKPKDMEIYKDNQGSELKISEYLCKGMPLYLSVEARYQALGRFIEKLETSKKPLISVIEIDMKKDENISPNIRAELKISACVLGE